MPTDTEDHEIPGRSNATARRSRPERNAVTESVSVQKERQRPRGAKHRSNGNRRIPGRSNATESEAYPKERSDGKRSVPKGATRPRGEADQRNPTDSWKERQRPRAKRPGLPGLIRRTRHNTLPRRGWRWHHICTAPWGKP